MQSKEVKVQCLLRGAERTVHLLPDLHGQYFSRQLLSTTFGMKGELQVYCPRGQKVSWLVIKSKLAVWLSPAETYFVVGTIDPERSGFQRVKRQVEVQVDETPSEGVETAGFVASLADILYYKVSKTYPQTFDVWARNKPSERVQSAKRAFRRRAERFGHHILDSGKAILCKDVVGDDGRLNTLPVLITSEDMVSALRRFHDDTHCGRDETIRRLSQVYYIVGVKEIVDKWIKSCPMCSVDSYQRMPRMKTYLQMDKPFERVHNEIFIYVKSSV